MHRYHHMKWCEKIFPLFVENKAALSINGITCQEANRSKPQFVFVYYL